MSTALSAVTANADGSLRLLRGAPSVAMGATPHMVHDTECRRRG